VITAVFAIGYTILAGMISVTYTDVLNGIVILAGISFAIPFALKGVGGLTTFAQNVPAEQWQIFGTMSSTKAFAYLLPTMFLLLGDANIYQRFLSARDEQAAKRSVAGWIGGTIVIETLIVFLAFLGTQLESNLEGNQAANIIPLIAVNHVPVVIGCILLAAMVAIIVSTADSYLLVPATNIGHDLYQRYFRPNASQRELLLVSRLAVLFLGILAFLMVSFFETILEAAYAAYTIYGAGITPALLAAFLWKRASSTGAMLSILGGSVVTISWEIVKKVIGHAPLDLDAIYPALVVSIILLVFGSLLWPREEVKT